MIKRLDWDSDFFNLTVGELEYDLASKPIDTIAFDLIYVKTQNDFNLEIPGYIPTFSETKIVFAKKLKEQSISFENCKSCTETTYYLADLEALAFESGKYSRFKLDEKFEKGKFEELYQKWVSNSLSFQFATDVIVYKSNETIAGFVTYKIHPTFATVGLLAVSPTFQGKGIGGNLLSYIEKSLVSKGIFELQIPTQLVNQPACSFYKKRGYQIIEKTHIKHYWKL